jgi:hypothetical protein
MKSGSDRHDSSGLITNTGAKAGWAERIANYSFDFAMAASTHQARKTGSQISYLAQLGRVTLPKGTVLH